MKICRICKSSNLEAVYSSPKPSLTSVCTFLDVPTSVFLCQTCFLAQKPLLPDIKNYYDKHYRISLLTDDHDQLYDVVNGHAVYRTDHQSDLVLGLVDIPPAANLLDYGAGKAATLKKVAAKRPDVKAFVFDVSDAYRKAWDHFIPKNQQASHEIPQSWKNSFSLVTAHFVLEHADDPLKVFADISELLTHKGVVFFTVPDLIENPGDLVAVDHISHFSANSISHALSHAGLTLESLRKDVFRGVLVCIARRTNVNQHYGNRADDDFGAQSRSVARFWSKAEANLEIAAKTLNAIPSAIYGAGVYGSYIAGKIQSRIPCTCFLDKSSHLAGTSHMNLPVYSPENIPCEVEVIYAGLNPKIARSVLEPLKKKTGKTIMYLAD